MSSFTPEISRRQIAAEILKVAKAVLAENDDYEYVPDPDHKHKPKGGGWKKTDAGWSRNTKEDGKGEGENKATQSPQTNPRVSRIVDGLFTEAEMTAPKVFNRCAGEEDFYRQAEGAQKLMLGSLDEGREKSWLGENARHETALTAEALEKPGPVLITAPIKGAKRAREKVEADYGGDWNCLTDGVRCSVAVDSFEDISGAIEGFKKKTGCKIVGPAKNRLKNRLDSGYGDILCNCDFGNGFVGEVQFHIKRMLYAKQFGGGHKLYERERSLRAKCGNDTSKLSKEEQMELNENVAEQRRIYGAAWDSACGRTASAKKTAKPKQEVKMTKYILSDKLYSFYLYGDHDAVAFCKGNNWPMMWNGREWRQVQSFLKFSDNSVEITRKEFEKEAKKQGVKFYK